MSDVDVDLLADFVGGALDGTPAAGQIRDRIATDPAWAAAHQQLVAAGNRVTDALRASATDSEPMPDEVAVRIHQLLVTEADRTGGQLEALAAPRPVRRTRATSRPPTRRPGGRRQRLLVAATAVAAIAGFAIVGGSLFARNSGTSDLLKSDQPAQTALRKDATSASLPTITATGRNYARTTLPAAAALAAPEAEAAAGTRSTPGNVAGQTSHPDSGGQSASGKPLTGPSGTHPNVPVELGRLVEPSALQACLAAIVTTHGGTASVVDYARFEGGPALVVVLAGVGPTPGQLVIAAGPACGSRPGWSDELFASKP